MACPIAEWAERMPGQAAIAGAAGALTYQELDALVRSYQQKLTELGLSRGDVVGTWADNGVDFIALLWACLRQGITVAPVNPRFPQAAARDALKLVDARAVFAPGRNADFLLNIDRPSIPSDDHAGSADLYLGSIATIIFTSGSTGRPKAAMLSLRNHAANAVGSADNIHIGPGDRWLLSLPLFHVGGLAVLFRCFLAGAIVVLPAADEALPNSVSSHGITHLSLVTTQLRRWLDSPVEIEAHKIKVHKIAAVLLGGSAIPTNLIHDALQRGLPIHTSYGMTEMGSQIATTKPRAGIEELRTSGYVLAERELRITEGGVQVRGATRFEGYITEGGIERPFDDDGWFTTGDTGYFDEVGRLVITGRLDDVFISAGENIQPRIIESALTSIPGIRQAVVVPVADDEYGSRPVAFVEAVGGFDAGELSSELRRTLPGLFVPIAYHGLPEPDVGLKVSRAQLRQLAEELRPA